MKTQHNHRTATFPLSVLKLSARSLCAATALLWSFLIPTRALAVGANPEPSELQQPNGARFQARTWGDEWQNGTETLEGYTILREQMTGWWVYAERDTAGNLSPSKSRVGNFVPLGLQLHLRAESRSATTFSPFRIGEAATPNLATPSVTGTHQLLVIVVDFTPSASLGTTELDWEQYFFTGGIPSAPRSVSDYWRTASYDQLTIEPAIESYGTPNNGVVFVTLDYAHPISESGDVSGSYSRTIVRDAIVSADRFLNFARYDTNRDLFITTDELHLFFVIRGYEEAYGGSSSCDDQPRIWAHRSALFWPFPVVDLVSVGSPYGASFNGLQRGGYALMGEWHCRMPNDVPGHMAALGVAVHELGHDFGPGAPDLYDTGSSIGTDSFGVGFWSLMAAGSWNGKAISGLPGTHPALPDPWVRSLFGFLTPREIATTTATVLPQIETATGPDRGVFQLLANPGGVDWVLGRQSGFGEYFLVENRQRTGDFDVALPGDGVLIWHVDESASYFNFLANSDEGTTPPGNSRLLVLEQADGRFDIECYASPSHSSRCNPGDSTDPWKNGTATTFNVASTPNSKRYDQSATGVSITNISNSGPVMSAILYVPSSPAISHSQPSLQPDGVVNGASFRSPSNLGGALAPGTIVAIFGTGLADFSTPAFSGPLPTTMGDTSVLFNGVPVPLLYVSSTQINAQLPFDLPLGAVTVQVRRGTVTTAAQSVRIGPVSPGIFSVRTQSPAAEAILLADHSGPVTDESPATPGSFVSIYCTGLGALRQGVSAGIISPNPSPETINRPLVNIANVPAPVTYSGLAPGLVGIYRVDVQIPMGVTAGDHPVQIFINGVFSNAVTIPISHTSSLTPRKVRATKFLGEVSMQDAKRSPITNPCCR